MVELRFHRKFHVELILIPKLVVNSYLNKQVCFLTVFALLLFLSAKYRFLSGLFIFKRNLYDLYDLYCLDIRAILVQQEIAWFEKCVMFQLVDLWGVATNSCSKRWYFPFFRSVIASDIALHQNPTSFLARNIGICHWHDNNYYDFLVAHLGK